MEQCSLLSNDSKKVVKTYQSTNFKRPKIQIEKHSTRQQSLSAGAESPSLNSDFSEEKDEKCIKHNSELLLFCLNDHVKICEKCIIYGSHKSHSFLELQIIEKKKNNYENFGEKMKEKVCSIKKLAATELFDRKIEFEHEKIVLEIELFIKNEIDKINTLKEKTLENLNTLTTNLSSLGKLRAEEFNKTVSHFNKSITDTFSFPDVSSYLKERDRLKTKQELNKLLSNIFEDISKLSLSLDEEMIQSYEKFKNDLEKQKTFYVPPTQNISKYNLEDKLLLLKNLELRFEKRNLQNNIKVDLEDNKEEDDLLLDSPCVNDQRYENVHDFSNIPSGISHKQLPLIKKLSSTIFLENNSSKQINSPISQKTQFISDIYKRTEKSLCESVVIPPSPNISPLNIKRSLFLSPIKKQVSKSPNIKLPNKKDRLNKILTLRAEKLINQASNLEHQKLTKILAMIAKTSVELSLNNTQLQDIDMAYIVSKSKPNSKLIELSVSTNELTTDGLSIILFWISKKKELNSIGTLNLQRNKIDETGVEILSLFLKDFPNSLHDIDLRNNMNVTEELLSCCKKIKINYGTAIILR